MFFAKPYSPDDIVKALNGIAAQVMGSLPVRPWWAAASPMLPDAQ